MKTINDKIKIYAYKHNGDFHRLWPETILLSETKDYYVTASPYKSRVIENNNHYWFTKEVAISYFSKKRWFNIIIMFKENEVVYYCNLASPVLVELDSLKYIDYDLDYKYFVNSQKTKVLDRKEFNVNKYKYRYPTWVENKIHKEMKILQEWVKNEICPFSKEFREKWYEEYNSRRK